MIVEISKIVNGIGEKITGNKIITAYKHLVKGNDSKAKTSLAKMHYDAYWTGVRNKTTDVIVDKIYKECNLVKPLSFKDCDPGIVRDAVTRRVQREIETAQNIITNGMKISPIVVDEGETYRLLDGYNRVCLMIASGETEIDVTIGKGKK